MSPSSTVHGGHHDTKYVTFEFLLHAAFVADEIWGLMLKPARTPEYIDQKKEGNDRPLRVNISRRWNRDCCRRAPALIRVFDFARNFKLYATMVLGIYIAH